MAMERWPSLPLITDDAKEIPVAELQFNLPPLEQPNDDEVEQWEADFNLDTTQLAEISERLSISLPDRDQSLRQLLDLNGDPSHLPSAPAPSMSASSTATHTAPTSSSTLAPPTTDDQDSDTVVLSPQSQGVASSQGIARAASTTSNLLNSMLADLHSASERNLKQQNCHFCGRNKKKEERVVCKNAYCSLQGLRVKYICKTCLKYQETYFAELGLDYADIFGDITDPNWYCPACIIWEDNLLPNPGICCCSFRRFHLNCPLHTEKSSTKNKSNFHCKPYKQKNTRKDQMRDMPIHIANIRVGSQPFTRVVLPSSGAQSSRGGVAGAPLKRGRKKRSVPFHIKEKVKEEQKLKELAPPPPISRGLTRTFSRSLHRTLSLQWLGTFINRYGSDRLGTADDTHSHQSNGAGAGAPPAPLQTPAPPPLPDLPDAVKLEEQCADTQEVDFLRSQESSYSAGVPVTGKVHDLARTDTQILDDDNAAKRHKAS